MPLVRVGASVAELTSLLRLLWHGDRTLSKSFLLGRYIETFNVCFLPPTTESVMLHGVFSVTSHTAEAS